MRRSILRPLDRYVFSEFWRIFVITALGFPILVIVIDLTDNLDKYLGRNIPRSQIFLSYLYWLPDSMFLVLPAAVLFATVFSIGAFTRHSEITAAKASGLSFHRVCLPIFIGAMLAAGFALGLGELVPVTNSKRQELLQERKFTTGTQRFNFAYAAEHGRVYKVSSLDAEHGQLTSVEVERKGAGPSYPTYVISSDQAWYRARRGWVFQKGAVHVMPDTMRDFTFEYDSLVDHELTEKPQDLLATPKAPEEMRYEELSRFITALERSGGDVNELKVERALKLAIPVTCIVIALFGAPLATSNQRGGTAYGIGISLGTTIVFLMVIQLTKAIGGKGILYPDVAAWLPNLAFGITGTILLLRVRT